jgi:hypothetical protein
MEQQKEQKEGLSRQQREDVAQLVGTILTAVLVKRWYRKHGASEKDAQVKVER